MWVQLLQSEFVHQVNVGKMCVVLSVSSQTFFMASRLHAVYSVNIHPVCAILGGSIVQVIADTKKNAIICTYYSEGQQ